jgi:hypothetical protein
MGFDGSDHIGLIRGGYDHKYVIFWCQKWSNLIVLDWSISGVKIARRVRTLRRRKWTRQEGNMGIKDLGGRWPLYLRKERPTANSIRGWSSRQRSHLGSEGTPKKTF